MGRSSAAGGDEARNPPLPVADTGGCSANEATSFASISVAKRLCRIVRPHGACACGGLLRGNASSISCRVPPAWPFLPTIAINYAPWHADRRSARGVRSTTKGESKKRTEESLLSSGRFRLSPAAILKQQSRLPDLFQQLSRPQYRFFGTFLTQESTVPMERLAAFTESFCFSACSAAAALSA